MRFRLAFDFSLGGEDSQQHGGIAMSSEWAETAAQHVRERQKAEEEVNAALIEKRKLIAEQGPALWRQVFCRVQELVSEFNAEYKHSSPMTYDNTSTSEFHVRLNTGYLNTTLIATFGVNSSATALQWRYEGGKAKGGGCNLNVLPSGKVALYYRLRDTTPNMIAEKNARRTA
jgi:hypothetical protein